MVMRKTENDQAEDKLDDVFETGLGERAHLI